MKIVVQKLLVPKNLVRGVDTYQTYPLGLFIMYNDDGVIIGTGMCATGPMEIPVDLNLDYSEADGGADQYRREALPMVNPNFLQSYDNLATRVEGE